MSFNAVAHTPAKIRGETIFRDSDILPDPYREGGAVILIVRTGEMGLEVLLDLRDLYVNYYNSSSATKLKSPAPDQVTLYRVGLANHLRPLLRQACGAGAVSRCTIS
jgi:hypothetical protein